MGFTAAQKTSIRFYTGWADRFYQTDNHIEQAMNGLDSVIDGGDTAAYDLIVTELDRCAAIDLKLDDAANRFKAAKVGSIDLPGGTEIALLRSQGRQAAGRIASILGVTVRHDVFSGVGPRDANHFGYLGKNEFPHG